MLLEYPVTIVHGKEELENVTGSRYDERYNTLDVLTESGVVGVVTLAKSGTNGYTAYECECGVNLFMCKHVKAIYSCNLDGEIFPYGYGFWEIFVAGNTARVEIKLDREPYAVGVVDSGVTILVGYISKGDGIGVVSRMIYNWFKNVILKAQQEDRFINACDSKLHGTRSWQREVSKMDVSNFNSKWELYFNGKCMHCRLLENFGDTVPVI